MKEYKNKYISKTKSTAILLAVFFNFWSWLYTWREDKNKFIISLALVIVLWWTIILPFAIWFWAIIDTSIKSRKWYEGY